MSQAPLVTVITATSANPLLTDVIESVHNQTYENIQHLIFVDGPAHKDKAQQLIDAAYLHKMHSSVDVIDLPYAVGIDRWNGHRMYGAGTYLADGDFVMYLDDDNTLHPDHVQSCMNVMLQGKHWTFSFRNIQDKDKNIICQDNCESLGVYPSVLHPEDYFVDVNCYFLRKDVAVSMSPLWYRKAREPNVPEVDRILCANLRQHFNNFLPTYRYTVNYTVGNNPMSVQKEFFLQGNQEMLRRYNGNLPWVV